MVSGLYAWPVSGLLELVTEPVVLGGPHVEHHLLFVEDLLVTKLGDDGLVLLPFLSLVVAVPEACDKGYVKEAQGPNFHEHLSLLVGKSEF